MPNRPTRQLAKLKWVIVAASLLSAEAPAQIGVPVVDESLKLGAQVIDEGAKLIDGMAKGLLGAVSFIVNPTLSKLSGLIAEKKFDEAERLYEAEKTAFARLSDEELELLRPLAAFVNARLTPGLSASVASLDEVAEQSAYPAQEWGGIKATLATAEARRQEYVSHSIVNRKPFQSPVLDQVSTSATRVRERLVARAVESFAGCGRTCIEGSFFEIYPVAVSEGDIARIGFARFTASVDNATPEELRQCYKRYGAALTAEQRSDFAKSYVAKLINVESATLKAKLTARRAALDLGLPGPSLSDLGIRVLEINDLPKPVATLSRSVPDSIEVIRRAQLPETTSNAQMVLVDLSESTIDRKVVGKEDRSSRYVTGQRQVLNPAYDAARIRYQQAEFDYQQAQANNLRNPGPAWAIVLQSIASVATAVARENASRELMSTPRTLSEDVYEEYTYSVSNVMSRKQIRGRLIGIDATAGDVVVTELQQDEPKTFSLAFNTNPKDQSVRGAFAEEKDIDAFENAQSVLSLDHLCTALISEKGRAKAYKGWSDIVAMYAVSSNASGNPGDSKTALATASNLTPVSMAPQTTSVSDRTAAPIEQIDRRFESIVIIHTPKGALGTGFYVAPDLVLTNQHVIEGAGFAEIVLFDGRKSFGKVVKTDLNLDLAVLRVADQGRPVEFHNAQVSAGATVDVIGHPKGLSYSLSRGVVSAVRKMQNPFVKGGSPVTYIQTDARINSGNSGGPMYVGDKVVGINTQKMTGKNIEGIGFAVHYAEAIRFIQD